MKSINKGENNGQWKGNSVSYRSLHEWVQNNKIKLKVCENCGEDKKLEWANISQRYKRDLDDWECLCRRCHMMKDGRLAKFSLQYKLYGKGRSPLCQTR